MKLSAEQKRLRIIEIGEAAGFKCRRGFGSAPKFRIYYTRPDGHCSHADDITGMKSAVAAWEALKTSEAS